MTDKAREHLEEVHKDLHEASEAGDPDAGELADHVGAYLAADEPTEEEHDALLDRLRTGVRRFEVNHPTLSNAVQGVVDSLTASGI
jgi:hypothetical protein